MSMKDRVILVGGFHEIIELCQLCNKDIVGIIDNNLKDEYLGYRVFGGDERGKAIYDEFKDVPLIICPDKPRVRQALANYYSKIGFRLDSLISPRAMISKSAKLGAGVVIQSGVNVSALVTIGKCVKLNSLCNIMHDSWIGDFVTIAPNAVVLGRVRILDLAYIGANATVLSGLTIGRESLVGAGSVVTKSVEDETLVVGNPTSTRREMK
jgi:sugar O-acyltransferase (sialic acid O-acetyltransferase NeuD family)